VRGHFGALRLPPAGSWPSHTARTEVRPCSTMPARAANNPALIPTARHAPESTSDSKSEKRVGSRLRADSASHEDGNHGCSVCARPGRPRNNINWRPQAPRALMLSPACARKGQDGVSDQLQGREQGCAGTVGATPPPASSPPPLPPPFAQRGAGGSWRLPGARGGAACCASRPQRGW